MRHVSVGFSDLAGMRVVWWLFVVLVAAGVGVAVSVADADVVLAQECPPENPNCGDPTFPPPAEPPVVTTTVPAEPPAATTTTVPGTGSAAPPVSVFGNPLWFLPPTPDFDFAYDQQNYDVWLAQCSGGASATNPFIDPALPEIFWELYGEAERACPDSQRASTTLLGEVVGGDVIGRADIPTGNYDIGFDEGSWNSWSRKLWGNVTDGLFSIDKWLTGSTINLLEWAFGFDLAARLSGPANTIASGYYVSLNGSSVSAYDLALFVTLAYFAIQLLRGRTGLAVGELAITYLVYAAFVSFVVLVPGGFGQLVTNTTEASGKLASSIAAITLEGQTNTADCPPAGGPGTELGDVVCPFGKGLHAAFVERPYDLANWGTDLDDPAGGLENCAAERDGILFAGPHGASDEPRFRMGLAGCSDLADFNHDPTAERAGLMLFVTITSALVLVLAAMTALTLIAAQLLLVGLIMVMPFAVVAGLMPGSGRALLWKWVAGIAKVLLTVVAIAVFLSLYLVTINTMIDATAGDSWLIQGGSLILVTITMFWVRSRLMSASKRAAAHTGTRLSSARVGGSHGGGFFAAAGDGFQQSSGRYIPYEVRSAYRDARQAPVNFREWRANVADRSAIRHGTAPTHMRPPPRGFTSSRRARSRARQHHKDRARNRRAARNSA